MRCCCLLTNNEHTLWAGDWSPRRYSSNIRKVAELILSDIKFRLRSVPWPNPSEAAVEVLKLVYLDATAEALAALTAAAKAAHLKRLWQQEYKEEVEARWSAELGSAIKTVMRLSWKNWTKLTQMLGGAYNFSKQYYEDYILPCGIAMPQLRMNAKKLDVSKYQSAYLAACGVEQVFVDTRGRTQQDDDDELDEMERGRPGPPEDSAVPERVDEMPASEDPAVEAARLKDSGRCHVRRCLKKAVTERIRQLWKRLIPDQTIDVQINFDAAGHLASKQQTSISVKVICPDGMGNNNPLNARLVLMYEGDDKYANLIKHGAWLAQQIRELELSGLEIDGVTWKIRVVLGADMKGFMAEMGHSGCSAKRPCFKCKVELDDPNAKNAAPRSILEVAMCAHVIIPGFLLPGYKCMKCNETINKHGDHGPKVDPDKADEGPSKHQRLKYQRAHDGQCHGHTPWLWFLDIMRYTELTFGVRVNDLT